MFLEGAASEMKRTNNMHELEMIIHAKTPTEPIGLS